MRVARHACEYLVGPIIFTIRFLSSIFFLFVMTPVEILALLFVLLILVKLIVIAVKPEAWMNLSNKLFDGTLTTVVALFLLVVVGFLLLQELTIVQLFASMAFFALLVLIGVVPFREEVSAFAHKLYKGENLLKRTMISVVIWVALSLWVLYSLFLQ